jgi:hypothetical protein
MEELGDKDVVVWGGRRIDVLNVEEGSAIVKKWGGEGCSWNTKTDSVADVVFNCLFLPFRTKHVDQHVSYLSVM